MVLANAATLHERGLRKICGGQTLAYYLALLVVTSPIDLRLGMKAHLSVLHTGWCTDVAVATLSVHVCKSSHEAAEQQ